jgi:outer membrane receptor protein involved in Fe transport
MKHTRRALNGATILSSLGASGVLVLCLAGAAHAQTSPTPSAKPKGAIEDIVITAERRRSTVQKTPVSITAVSGKELQQRGLTSVEDVTHEVAGISMRSAGPGQTEYESRGLASNGGSSPTVGFYLNDTPLSPPPNGQTGKVVIDPSLYDVDRVEVLRGPQGTLYGSGSMGGTIRILTNQPKLDTYEGSVEGIGSGTVGGGLNGTGNIMVNLPIVNDKLAIRVVATDTARSGFIDRVVLDPFPFGPTGRGNVVDAPVAFTKHDANTEKLQNARLEALFKPNDWLTFSGTVMWQDLHQGGYDEFQQPPGNKHLDIYQAFNLDEPINDHITIYSLTGTADLDYATLTSVTSLWSREQKQRQDASENEYYVFAFSKPIPQLYAEYDYASQFTQEVRLASQEGQRLQWVLGAFYSDMHALWQQWGADPADGVVNAVNLGISPALGGGIPDPAGIIFGARNPYSLKQYAGFGTATYAITDKLKASVGLRFDRFVSKELNNEWGVGLSTVTPLKTPIVTKAAGDAETPRFNLSYQATPDVLAYATIAQGYRPGGANQYVPGFCGAPVSQTAAYRPDGVWNYEAGEKGRFLDGRLTINGDLYYIHWYGIQQLSLLQCGYEYFTNAGNGHAYGPELEGRFSITPEWAIAGEGSYTDAAITHPSATLAAYDLANAKPGTLSDCHSVTDCTLPILNVPNYSGSLSLIYSRPLPNDLMLTSRLTDVYVGPSVDESATPIIHLPPYNVVNFRAGVSGAKWTAALFADNLTNKHATITANNTSFQWNTAGYYRASTNQPLTIGVDLSYRF